MNFFFILISIGVGDQVKIRRDLRAKAGINKTLKNLVSHEKRKKLKIVSDDERRRESEAEPPQWPLLLLLLTVVHRVRDV